MTPSSDAKIMLSIITPDKCLFEGLVSMVVIPGDEGDFGVLPRHMSLVSILRSSDVRLYQGQEMVRRIPITGGVAEVSPHGCRILADGLDLMSS